jgi:hypothetical protein
MIDRPEHSIAQSMSNFQAALRESGESLEQFINQNYCGKWLGDDLYHALAIRTTFVNAMHTWLTKRGLFNIERVSLSPVTDPLAHDIEHTPAIRYKGHHYMTTHSMIYSKFLACFNPKIKGIFVDSPNIRLEIESPRGQQRGKYLIDFSQMDVEVRRNRGISLEEYLNDQPAVEMALKADMESALKFFEELLIHAMSAVADTNEADLAALGVAIEPPRSPFPRFLKDEAQARFGGVDLERKLGEEVKGHFFWITGLLRENYDLVYPYLLPDGSRVPLAKVTSASIYNYDICAQALIRKTRSYGPAYEILSGGLREWLFEPIIERLVENKILPVRPEIVNGNINNIDQLGGYGPFLMAVSQKDDRGKPLFPDTFGGGVGIERALFALLKGDKISKVDDVTLFGKNPDSHPMYLF